MYMPIGFQRGLAAACGAVLLLSAAGCGGSDSEAAEPSPGFDLTAAVPEAHRGRLTLHPSTRLSNEFRAPDVFSADPYCLVRYTGLVHGGGKRYDMAVAYRAADRRVLAVTLHEASTDWSVAAFNPDAATAEVDAPQRRIRLARLRSTQGTQVGWEATVAGYGELPTVAGCS